MPDLETRLRHLGAEAAWPVTPDLAAHVAARLRDEPAQRPTRFRRPRRRRLLAAIAALLLLTPAAAFAFPEARDDVLRALGLRHVTVRRVATPPPAAADPELGPRTTLAAAARAAGFTPLLSAALGGPDRVHRRGDVVTLVYARRGLLLAQAPGRLERDLLEKIVSIGEGIRRVRVAGRPGLFFPSPHLYLWIDDRGAVRESKPVRSGPSIVWERDGVVLRLEGERREAAAVRLAAAVR
jgi:hypothetical protein